MIKSVPEGRNARNEDFLACADGQPIWISEQVFYPPANMPDCFPSPSNVYADIFFDRPLYRPGDAVHWKIIARESRN